MTYKKIYIVLPALLFVAMLFFSAYTPEKGDESSASNSTQRKSESFQYVTPPPLPKQLSFAGEDVPLEQFDILERFDRELIVNCYFHSQTIRFIKLAPRYFDIIEPILKKNNIPDDFKYLAVAESGFDPRAISPAGAAGIWQLLQGTARDYGLEVTTEVDERYHIEKATEAACKYLQESYEKYSNWTTVAASYNAGRKGIDRQIDRQKVNHYYDMLLSEETNRYVFRILALKTILENPESYGFNIPKNEFYTKLKTKTIEVKTSIPDFAVFANQHNTNYKMLKEMNPWLRDTKLTIQTDKTYEIKILNNKHHHQD